MTLLIQLNDVTTTPDSPPHFTRQLAYDPAAPAKQARLYPDLRPLKLKQPIERVFIVAKSLVAGRPDWQLAHEDQLNWRLEWVATSPLLKFKDDVVMLLKNEDQGVAVHMRSRSRVGRSDLGANARRIRDFLAALEQTLNQ